MSKRRIGLETQIRPAIKQKVCNISMVVLVINLFLSFPGFMSKRNTANFSAASKLHPCLRQIRINPGTESKKKIFPTENRYK